MRLLVCDIGNTSIKFAVEAEGELGPSEIIRHSDFSNSVLSKLSFDQVAISSVVPEKTQKLVELIETQYSIKPLVISRNSKFSLSLDYETPETLGIDRICGAEGAYRFYCDLHSIKSLPPETVLVIVDCGTATTINTVESPAKFSGGVIAPGLITMINSLSSGTAQLPNVDLENYQSVIGKNTNSCITSGIINSTLGLVERVITNIEHNDKSHCEIFLTGGNAGYIASQLQHSTMIDNLVMRGISSIFKNERSE